MPRSTEKCGCEIAGTKKSLIYIKAIEHHHYTSKVLSEILLQTQISRNTVYLSTRKEQNSNYYKYFHKIKLSTFLKRYLSFTNILDEFNRNSK